MHDFMSLPLMVRPNTVIAIGDHQDRPDYDYSDGVTLRVYEFEDGKRVSLVIPSVKGEVEMKFEIKRENGTLTVERHGASNPWKLLLVGINSVKSVNGGTVESTPTGTLVTARIKTNRLKISLASSG